MGGVPSGVRGRSPRNFLKLWVPRTQEKLFERPSDAMANCNHPKILGAGAGVNKSKILRGNYPYFPPPGYRSYGIGINVTLLQLAQDSKVTLYLVRYSLLSSGYIARLLLVS